VLSHAGGDAATTELSYAECLSGLGTYIQPQVVFPEIRAKFRKFQDENSELLIDWAPHYHVGLAYFNNQLHLENMEHVLQVYKFSRYLLDQHILFHFLTEEDLSPENRLPCRVLVLPSVSYMSDEQIQGVERFLGSGGICLATGEFAIGNERALPREKSVAENLQGSFPERFVHVDRVSSLIPDDKISLDSTRQFSRTTWKTLNVPGSQSFEAMKNLDEELGIQRYLDGEMFESITKDRLGFGLQLTPSREALGIRYNAYGKEGNIALHIVNYNIDLLEPKKDRRIDPVEGIHVSLPAPAEFSLGRASSVEPGKRPGPIEASVVGNRIEIDLPVVNFYRLVLLEASDPN
jgi:hypothetical protein